MLAEAIVFELCRSGALDENIAFVKGALQERRDALVEALGEHLPEAEFVVPGGGYFLWLTLNEDVDTAELCWRAASRRAWRSSPAPTSCSRAADSSLRLSFASVPPDQIGEGVARHRPGAGAGARRQPGLTAHRRILLPRPLHARLAVALTSAMRR